MMEFVIPDMPDGLTPGTYGARVESAEWVGDRMQIKLKLDAPITDENKYTYLFKIRAEEI